MSESIINAYTDSYIISLGEIACTSLYFWDWILTMGDEIDIIWRRKLKTSGYLFIALRYLSFGLMVFNLYAFTRGTFSTQAQHKDMVILQLRVYVMYMRSRTILRVNAVIFAAEIALAVGMWFHFSAKIQYLPFSADCGYCSIYPRELGICFIPPLLYEASLALLMMRKSWESRTTLHQLGHGHTNIFYVLIRDSIIYFILVSSAMAACMIYFFAAPQQALWADM
ncbi:hypothetical protein EXIGLDRAFT_775526 [Exidia glandulosa HHB12029]|uniref:DUF6533 domain-containing protein n=1 Tax=Exidia glandulosa HHB12029 TaxID=1314781 RepID=A0A165DVQ4_EXIGL|nr:hypothetical protein EXIGLDRAFT_775526 [Exidia glandulosa HHB12029]